MHSAICEYQYPFYWGQCCFHCLYHRFRDQQLLEVLESAYGMMRNDYLLTVQSLQGTASSWQQYEVALYGIRAVSIRCGLQYFHSLTA